MPWRRRWRSLPPWTAFQSARSPTASLAAQTRNDSLSLVGMHKPEPREATGFHAKRAKAQSPSNPSKNGLKSTSKPKATGRPHSLTRKKTRGTPLQKHPSKTETVFRCRNIFTGKRNNGQPCWFSSPYQPFIKARKKNGRRQHARADDEEGLGPGAHRSVNGCTQ